LIVLHEADHIQTEGQERTSQEPVDQKHLT
jgi:hypothetical protein